MLPAFPVFRPLLLSDKTLIASFTKDFPVYSDFVFSSLWSWNMDDTVKLSTLNGNLVIQFGDYVTNKQFLSFLGKTKPEQTASRLLASCQQLGMEQVLKLIPEEVIQMVSSSFGHRYHIREDRDNFDYLLSVARLSTLSGRRLHQKRKMLHHFFRQHGTSVSIRLLEDENVQKNVLSFYEFWMKQTGKSGDIVHEYDALQRLCKASCAFDCRVLFAYQEKRVIGFTIFEMTDSPYAISAFQKGDRKISGIYEFLNHQMALYIADHSSCQWINIEQDLGVEALRRAKEDYDPMYLKKYTIQVK